MPRHQQGKSSNKRGAKPRSQCEAAYDAGTLFNQLGFILRQAWLLPDENLADEVDCLWGRLALIVRELVIDCGARDRLHDTVLEAEQSWHRQFESTDRQLRRLQEGAALREAFNDGRYEQEREDGCQWLLEPVTQLLNELRRCIELDLSPGLAEVFRLGAFVDSGARGSTIYREMFPPAQEIRLDKVRPLGWGSPAPVPPPSHLPSVKVDRSRNWPESRWWDLLRQRCAELGIEFSDGSDLGETVEQNGTTDSMDDIAALVRRSVLGRDASSNSGERSGPEMLPVLRHRLDDGTEPGRQQAERKALAPSRTRAYRQYLSAVERNRELSGGTDDEVYEAVKQQLDGEEDLPELKTWKRYVREARAYHDARKNAPRPDRPHGKSVVSRHQI
ncbi:MAG TPA: hypothetical protein VG125_00165 [Pirellulales bacterium]|jgi:hypothetical protein|nr:hypothetical protein [Pirellulales bacterium]